MDERGKSVRKLSEEPQKKRDQKTTTGIKGGAKLPTWGKKEGGTLTAYNSANKKR